MVSEAKQQTVVSARQQHKQQECKSAGAQERKSARAGVGTSPERKNTTNGKPPAKKTQPFASHKPPCPSQLSAFALREAAGAHREESGGDEGGLAAAHEARRPKTDTRATG